MIRVCVALSLCGLAFGQNPPGELSFEVASVRPAGPETPNSYYYKIDDSQADLGSVSLSELFNMAYRRPWDVVEPEWMAHQMFDLHARLPVGSTKDQVPEMLQTLLAERFGLKFHREQKVIPSYALTVAKDGPRLHDAAPGDAGDAGACDGGFRKICRKVTMEDLARILSQPSRMAEKYPAFANMAGALDRPVVDMTGLKGMYDFELVAGRVGGGRGAGGRGVVDPQAAPGADPEIVSMFDAMKALGLKLEPTKHTYEILVIDHIERAPTEN